MKRIPHTLMLLLFGSAAMLQCTDQEEGPGPEKVQFTFSLAEVDGENGRTLAGDVPDALLLSLETGSGESVFVDKKITLLRMGDSFVTEPVELTPGRYNITDFRLAVDETTVLYATPLKGSPLSKAVNHPLPYPLTVFKNKASTISMEVIKVGTHAPEEFGYASFGINAVNPLHLSVFIPGSSGNRLTGAKAWIVEGDDTIKIYNLGAIVNLISFPGDPQVLRKLIVTKSGYNTVEKEFVYDDLIETLDGLPWKIILVPSLFTIDPVLNFANELTYSEMRLTGMPGNLTVDWGDGVSETIELGNDEVNLHHEYVTEGNFRINITGDLNKVTEFYQFYGQGQSKAINLQGLTELKDLRFGWTSNRAEVVDLSHNTKLEIVFLAYSPQMKKVILAEDNVVNYVELTGPNAMSTAAVDALIGQLYQGVVAHNTTGGTFYAASHYLPGGDSQMVGPPSPAAIAKLQELRDTYSWHVAPLP